jgi:hypothetical protein
MMRLPSFSILPNEVTMAHNICPDNGLPRLWRPVEPGSLGFEGGRRIVSLMLPGNIQLLDKELLEGLPELDRLRVLHTGADFVTV